MKKNIGTTDKMIRLVLAGTIIILYFTNVISGVLATILLILAAVFIVTAFIKFCPLYYPFGFTTRAIRDDHIELKQNGTA